MTYEDVASRNAAIGLCERVFQTFNGDPDFQADWWAFKYLSTAELGEQAARAAADSDLLIVAADSPGDFSHDIQYWFERWLSKLSSRAQPDGALVAFLPQEAEQKLPKETYLKAMARRAKLDYLRVAAPTITSGTMQGGATAPIEEPAEHRYHIPDWGINE